MVGNPEFFKDLLKQCFDTGVEAAKPDLTLPDIWKMRIRPWLDRVAPNRQTLWVYGAGKAAAAMAQALELACGESEKLDGFVVTRRGHALPTQKIRVIEAAHPVPDEDGQRAAKSLLRDLSQVPANDAVIALISGGGSSLLSVPVRDIPFVDLQQLNRALLACGAPIQEINIVRKHVTRTLGGQLAQVCGAPVFQLLISDVPGDDPVFIASGPFAPDDSTFAQAAEILKRWAVQVPHTVRRYIDRGCRGEVAETPDSKSRVFDRVQNCLLASNALTLSTVTKVLERAGYQVLSLGDTVEGEARCVARVVASMVRQAASGRGGWPEVPLAILSGGECTVTLSEREMRQAKGGRNSEFLLALSFYLVDLKTDLEIAAMAADTDGIDGVGGHAGAFLLPGDADEAIKSKIAPQWHLDQHTSYDYFHKLNRLLITGPTATNVNDLRIVLIGRPSQEDDVLEYPEV